ncbi:lytic transglycosylase domain-containing protein [Stutzerimonas stutzeri]|uniref:lytic transglycosylase domain-containing protein n=1 Tax=Stutzerimonas stutzeri TaxID=316 RepID=UPI0015E3135B|nr:lytic transglycosylase domain-containing protein [Stutzerimonas stutzeri]MBA1280199.1 lytic transglycosylase domain-containing protein [Stutzerimonas stutzeri]
MLDLPPSIIHGEIPQACVVVVSQAFKIEPELLGGILFVEGGRKGMANKNTNGSYDFGPAQINSAWLDRTEPVGVGAKELQHDACKNLWAAGWIMRRCLNKFQSSFWHGVGCYHTGENPRTEAQLARQRAYAAKVFRAVKRTRGPFLNWLAKG